MTRRLFDAHFHIIDPRFPLLPNNGYLPEAFSCDDYRSRMKGYELSGGAVVSGSFQGYDQSYLLAALGELGPGFVGVTQVPATVTDEEVISLDRAGVRGVRFNLNRRGKRIWRGWPGDCTTWLAGIWNCTWSHGIWRNCTPPWWRSLR